MTAPKPAPGEFAPWFKARALSGLPNYSFDTTAGRHVVLLFFGSATHPPSRAALQLAARHRNLFDDVHACFFGVTIDPSDETAGRIRQELPGIRYFLDFDKELSALYGADTGRSYDPYWLVLDPRLRVLGRFPVDQGGAAMECLRRGLEQPDDSDIWAPALVVPRILEPELCRELIARYEAHGGQASGFMRDVNGRTTELHDPAFKQRRDYFVDDEELRKALVARIRQRLVPSIHRAFAFHATRIERYLVACYTAGAGHFRAHRDNTTRGTAHRRFAVTINLNAEEYEGGNLRFPEFGARSYRAPTGGAVVFSCSLLHEAMPVTRGRRYAFLPFLYDEPAAEIRRENLKYLAGRDGDAAAVAELG